MGSPEASVGRVLEPVLHSFVKGSTRKELQISPQTVTLLGYNMQDEGGLCTFSEGDILHYPLPPLP